MPQPELLRRVIDALGAAGIPYMVTGSVASSLQGEPRLTHDIDVVVQLDAPAVGALVQSFPPADYYLDAAAAYDAIARRDMFNLLEHASGDKVDFWMLTDEPYDQERFRRRRTEEYAGMRLWVPRPEDTILQKLRWAELSGGSEKQFTDALRVFEVQHAGLDLSDMEGWVDRLKIRPWWERLQREADPL